MWTFIKPAPGCWKQPNHSPCLHFTNITPTHSPLTSVRFGGEGVALDDNNTGLFPCVINKITNRFKVPVLASQSKCLLRRAKAKKEKTGLRLLREGRLAKRLLHAWPMAPWRSYKASSWRYVKDALRGGEVSGPLDTALQ